MVSCRFAAILAFGLFAHASQLACSQDGTPRPGQLVQDGHRVAFLDLDESEFGGLLESQLLSQTDVDWIEREQIDAILREKRLLTAATESLQDRVRLGSRLNADALVIVRQISDPENEGQKHIEVIVCETLQGLRLWHTAIDQADDRDRQAADIAKLVVGTLRQPLDGNRIAIAVPPFFSEDLLYDYDYLKSTYARVLELYLARQPGMVVVSLQEAESLAREVRLGEEGVLKRSLPYYLIGAFHHQGHAAALRVALTLSLKLGNREIARRESGPLLPTDAAAWLQRASSQLLKKFELPTEPLDRDGEEAGQLLERALVFKRVGNWDEFYLLVESGLLLAPNHVQLRREGVTARLEYFSTIFEASRRNPKELERAIAVFRQAVNLYEAVLRDDLPRPKQSRMAWHKQGDVGSAGRALIRRLNVTSERPEFVAARDEVRQSLLRICKFQALGGWHNYANYLEAAVNDLPEEERYDSIYEFILEFKDHPEATRFAAKLAKRYYSIGILDNAQGEALVKRLISTDNEKIQSAGYELQRELVRHRSKPEKQMIKASPQKRLVSEVRVERVVWNEQPPPRDKRLLRSIEGCIPMPGRGDVIFGTMGVYVMHERGTLTRLWYGRELNQRVQAVCYDGRFVWVVVQPFNRSHAAFAVMCDPANGKTREITSADGFPAADVVRQNFAAGLHHSIAPIEPGRVLVAGDIGRTWVGVISAELDGPVNFQLIHQARDSQEDPFDETSWKHSAYYFDPIWMSMFWVDGKHRALLCRGGNGAGRFNQHPLVIDIEHPGVEIVKGRVGVIHPQGFARYDTTDTAWIGCGRLDNFGTKGLIRLEFPDFEPQIIHRRTPLGAVLITDGHLHVIGEQWWTARFDGHELLDRKFTLMADDLPFRTDRSSGPEAFHSHHYGVIIDGYAPTTLPVLDANNDIN